MSFFKSKLAKSLILMGLLLCDQLVFAAGCPLDGTWDTGFTTRKGSHYTRIVLTFDCDGHAEMDTTFLRGRMYAGAGEKYQRKGRYVVTGNNSSLAGALNVDVTIDAFTIMYLDANSVRQAADNSDSCRTPNPQLLVPQSILGLVCSDANYPKQGDIERGVALIEGDHLYWSSFSGTERVVVQPRNEAMRRVNSVDKTRVFTRITH